jgi:SAM-dependent methyltransferase
MLRPSPFILQWLPEIKSGGSVLDLACGKGRHTRAALDAGFHVSAVDSDVSGLAMADKLEIIQADLEAEAWPLEGRTFDGVIVTNYLWRPLFALLRHAVGPGGLILYETFTAGNERYGKPSNPDFLLEEGELAREFGDGFETLLFEHQTETGPVPAVRQRLAARKLQF